MNKRVKEVIEVRDYQSLDGLIAKLREIHDTLPEGADAELKMRGDDVFGRRLSVTYFRAQTEEEAACDARYADAYRASCEQAVERLQREMAEDQPQRRLRAVA